jgi:hypothetical protein
MTSNNDFLPEGYEVPTSGGSYFKLKQGQNTFRVISKPVIGWLGWTNDNKPERRKSKDDFAGVDLKDKVKHFWAFGVYDLNTNTVQVMELTQATILNALTELFKNPAWGSPFGYNITITKTGESLETSYTVTPTPPSELPNSAQDKVLETPLNLEALFDYIKTTRGR